jgi:hypothetical protein
MSQQIGFKENDIVFMIDKNKNCILTDKKFIIRNIEVENGDGFEETYYAYLEDIDTEIVERKMIIYKHFGYNWNYVYISNTTF